MEGSITQEERLNRIKGLIELVEVIINAINENDNFISADFINDYAFLIEPSSSLEGGVNEAENYKISLDKDDLTIMKNLSIAINMLADHTSIESRKLSDKYSSQSVQNLVNKPELVTGIADFVQVYITHTIDPVNHLIAFHVKFINITDFVIKRLRVNIALSENVETLPSVSNEFVIDSLSTKEVFKYSLEASLKSFNDCNCIVFTNLDPDESCPSDDLISIQSLPYNISLIDLIKSDLSACYCETKFRDISNTMKFSFAKHCEMDLSPPELKRIAEGHDEFALDSDTYEVAKTINQDNELTSKKQHMFTIAYETG